MRNSFTPNHLPRSSLQSDSLQTLRCSAESLKTRGKDAIEQDLGEHEKLSLREKSEFRHEFEEKIDEVKEKLQNQQNPPLINLDERQFTSEEFQTVLSNENLIVGIQEKIELNLNFSFLKQK